MVQYKKRILGVDYGTRRTGIAVSDLLGMMAQGIETVYSGKMEIVAQKVVEHANNYDVSAIVLGLPKNMNNSVGERGDATIELAEHLKSIISIPIILWDERLTTVQAIKTLNETNTRGKKRQAVVDTVAAQLILQNYLDSMKGRDE